VRRRVKGLPADERADRQVWLEGSDDFGISLQPVHESGEHGQRRHFKHLENVRPGNGYVPAFPLFQKVDVNGAFADPLFKWLRDQLPLPFDNPYGNTIPAQMLMLWEPASRTDIDWNFSKFLISRNGAPIKRWSEEVATSDSRITTDIEHALNNQTRLIEVLPDYAYARAHTIVRPVPPPDKYDL